MAKEKNIRILNLAAGEADANGVWTYVGNLAAPFTVHVHSPNGIEDVSVCASNRIPKPANTEHEATVTSFTGSGLWVFTSPATWVKARQVVADDVTSVHVQGNVA